MKTRTIISALLLSSCCSWSARAEKNHSQTAFQLFDPGNQTIIDYEKFGVFSDVGSPKYRYYIQERDGLAKAVGEGVYPNVLGLLKDPEYQKAKYAHELEGSVWDYVNSDDLQLNFYKWASNQDQPAGLRQFYIAQMLEKANLIPQAIKAYQACVVHFPKTTGNTFWKTPWYVGPTSMDSVSFLTRTHPELGMKLVGGRVRILNRYDDDPHNDVFEVDPGRMVSVTGKEPAAPHADLSSIGIKRQLGNGKVHLVQYTNNHWQLLVDGAPYVVRGMAYSATPVGKTPDNGSLVVHRDWMVSDDNKNGKIDGPYDSWVGKYREGKLTGKGSVTGDFKLLKEMGVNTLRLYHHGFNKELLKALYEIYGIHIIMGDYLGAYAVGSGADWNAGTDYTDPSQQQKMLDSVKEMVNLYKDEPYIIYWVLGNENNYGGANNSREKTDIYYQFVNKAAQLIKSIDKNHPVALCNGDLLFMDKAAKLCPDIDIYGANAYRGPHGFGDSFWMDLADEWRRPVFISEFGCPAYHHIKPVGEAEALQAAYLKNNWDDIERNVAGGPGAGNAIGGVVFEWLDEWWKAGPPPQYDPLIHDIVGQFGGPFPDGWSYEEWYGIVGQGDGKNSPYERQLRKAYFMFKELWSPKELAKREMPL